MDRLRLRWGFRAVLVAADKHRNVVIIANWRRGFGRRGGLWRSLPIGFIRLRLRGETGKTYWACAENKTRWVNTKDEKATCNLPS
jgi:hypothetical protein